MDAWVPKVCSGSSSRHLDARLRVPATDGWADSLFKRLIILYILLLELLLLVILYSILFIRTRSLLLGQYMVETAQGFIHSCYSKYLACHLHAYRYSSGKYIVPSL